MEPLAICKSCSRRGVTWDQPSVPCEHCGDSVDFGLEEAILDIDARLARVLRTPIDVTVRYGVLAGVTQLAAMIYYELLRITRISTIIY